MMNLWNSFQTASEQLCSFHLCIKWWHLTWTLNQGWCSTYYTNFDTDIWTITPPNQPDVSTDSLHEPVWAFHDLGAYWLMLLHSFSNEDAEVKNKRDQIMQLPVVTYFLLNFWTPCLLSDQEFCRILQYRTSDLPTILQFLCGSTYLYYFWGQ